jgi:hypothetical protein
LVATGGLRKQGSTTNSFANDIYVVEFCYETQ